VVPGAGAVSWLALPFVVAEIIHLHVSPRVISRGPKREKRLAHIRSIDSER